MKRGSLLWILVVPAAGAAGWYGVRPTPVTVLRPQRKDVTVTVALNGVVRTMYTTGVGCHLKHQRVKRVLVKEGEIVRRGQPLLEIQDTEAKQDLARAEARELHAREVLHGTRSPDQIREWARFFSVRSVSGSAWKRKRKALEALKMAWRDGSPTCAAAAQRDLSTARATLTRTAEILRHLSGPYKSNHYGRDHQAIVSWDLALEAVRDATQRLTPTIVAAPEPGQVASILVTPGQLLCQNERLVELATADSLSVSVALPRGFRKGGTLSGKTYRQILYPQYIRQRGGPLTAEVIGADVIVTVTAAPGVVFHGLVSGGTWGGSGDEIARVRLVNAPCLLRPGTTANVKFITGRYRHALTVPRAAIVGGPSNASVLVVRDGCAVRQPIKVDGWWLREVVVTEGLGGGEVAIKQPERVNAGQRVRPILAR